MTVPAIRPARAEDAAPLRALVARAWEEYPGLVFRLQDAPELAEPAAYYAAESGGLWVAEEAGCVVGSVAALPQAPAIWEIAKMYVAPAWRGGGLAARLLATGEAYARGQGAQRLVLWSDTRFAPAHRFYEKHHYVRRAPLRALGDSCHSLEFPFLRPLAGETVWELDTPAAASAARRLVGLRVAAGEDRAAAGSEVAAGVRAVATGRGRMFGLWVDGILAAGALFAADAHEAVWRAAGAPLLATRLEAAREGAIALPAAG